MQVIYVITTGGTIDEDAFRTDRCDRFRFWPKAEEDPTQRRQVSTSAGATWCHPTGGPQLYSSHFR